MWQILTCAVIALLFINAVKFDSQQIYTKQRRLFSSLVSSKFIFEFFFIDLSIDEYKNMSGRRRSHNMILQLNGEPIPTTPRKSLSFDRERSVC